jgi:hypothetical protein
VIQVELPMIIRVIAAAAFVVTMVGLLALYKLLH